MKFLELRLLGGLLILLDDIPLDALKSRKGRALFCYLAVTGKTQTRSTLAGLLWADMPEERARANLRKTLSRLKPHLGSHLTIHRETIAFNQDAAHRLDVADFTAGVRLGDEIESLQEAISLYQGDFLDGFYLPDAPLFDEWTLAQRAHLRVAAVRGLKALMVHFAREKDYPMAISCARRLLDIEPWYEEAHRELMGLLAFTGQRSAALRQFDLCQRILVDELGVDPSQATVTLYEQIRGGQIGDLTLPDEATAIKPLKEAQITHRRSTYRHNLPPQTTPFIGRENELDELTRLLEDPSIRLITIFGAGGMGKTRLAIEAALSQLDQFRLGVYFVPLTSLDNPTQIISAIAETIGYSFHEGDDPLQQLIDYLRPKKLLLLIDNFEHMLSETRLVTTLLQAASDLKIMITSRARLNLQAEQLFPISGIDFPLKAERLEEAIRYDAVKLFIHSARRIQPGMKFSDEDMGGIISICRLVEGMPLAILLAAAWIEVLSPAQIDNQITKGLDILEIQFQDAPMRHWSIRAVFDHTWKLMTEREKQVFKNTSVFLGGFTAEAAIAITKTSLHELRSLINKSLLSRTATGRFQMHELLRQYAAEKLHLSTDEYEAAREIHSGFYCTLLHRMEGELKTSRRLEALAEINTERENVRAAWNWSVSQRNTDRLEQALESLGSYYHWRGRYLEGEEAFRAAADAIATVGTEHQQRLLVRILIWQATFNRELGRTELAMQLSQQSLELLDSPILSRYEMRLERAAVLYELGSATLRRDYGEARRMWEQSYELYRATGERWRMAHVLGYLSMIAWELGEYDEAKKLIEENLAIQQSLGNQSGIGDMFSTLGWIALTQGQLEQAEQLAHKCTTYYRETGDQSRIAKGFRDLAAPKIFLGRFSEAETLLEESATIFDELGGSGDLVFTNILLGATNAHLGRYGKARSREELGLELAKKFEDRSGVARALLWLGRIALIEEAYAEAQHHMQESYAIFREVGQKDQLSAASASLGLANLCLGDNLVAHNCLVEAMQTAVSIGAFLPLLFAIPLSALLAANRGEVDRAAELYSQASRYPFVSQSHWCRSVYGRHMRIKIGKESLEENAIAQDKNTNRDLWDIARKLLVEME